MKKSFECGRRFIQIMWICVDLPTKVPRFPCEVLNSAPASLATFVSLVSATCALAGRHDARMVSESLAGQHDARMVSESRHDARMGSEMSEIHMELAA